MSKLGRFGAIGLILAILVWTAVVLFPDQAQIPVRFVSHRGPGALLVREPAISWIESTPESQGIDQAKLKKLSDSLSTLRTSGFLVLRNNYLVHEWYRERKGMSNQHYTAAAAKAVVAGLILLVAVDDGWISLEDPVWKYVPSWRSDPWKSKVTIRQTASHRSGMEDIWGGEYTKQGAARFDVALDHAALLFEPGTRQSYSVQLFTC